MSRTRLALAPVSLALMAAGALAQGAPSYESRGYGGPLYVGPNFQQGGQSAPPVYDSSRSVERYRAPQRLDRVQRKRTNDDAETAKKTPEPSKESTESKEAKAQNENSSIVSISTDKPAPAAETPKTDTAKADAAKSRNENSTIASVASSATAKAAPAKAEVTKADTDGTGKPTGCKRYFPTVGQTLSVPCD